MVSNKKKTVLTSGWALLVPTIWSSYITRVEIEYVLFCHLHLILDTWTRVGFLASNDQSVNWVQEQRAWHEEEKGAVLPASHGLIKGRLFAEICVWVAVTSALAVAALDNAPFVIFLPTNPHHMSSKDSMLNIIKSTSGTFSQLVCSKPGIMWVKATCLKISGKVGEQTSAWSLILS